LKYKSFKPKLFCLNEGAIWQLWPVVAERQQVGLWNYR